MLYNIVGYFQIQNLRSEIMAAGVNIDQLDQDILAYLNPNGTARLFQDELLKTYQLKTYIPMVGASGAIFGLSAAFAILFPNTELMLIFFPVPIKAKYLIGGYFIYEVYSSIFESQGDHIAHLAHVGGAITGAIIIFIWQRRKKHFY